MRALFNTIGKVIGAVLLILAAVLLLAFNILLLWVASGPRSLERFTPYIEEALAPADHAYSIRIKETWLAWDGWQHPIDIQLRQVAVVTRQERTFAQFPEISLGVDVLSLPFGRIMPTSLTINHPVLSLFQNEDRSISFGFRQEAQGTPPESNPAPTVPFSAVLALLLTPEEAPPEYTNLRKLHFVTIANADVSVGNVQKGVFFKASDATLVFRRDWRGNVKGVASAKISYGHYNSLLNAQFKADKDASVIEGSLSATQLMPGALAALFSDNAMLVALKLPVNGKGAVNINKSGGLQSLRFSVDGGKGIIDTPQLETPLKVTSLHADGAVSDNGDSVALHALSADLDGILLKADALVSLKDHDTAISGHATLNNALATDIRKLWPPALSPDSRNWVITNITGGKVPEADVTVAIAYGDLAKPHMPQTDIDAAIHIDDAKIRYLPDHPEVSHVKGVVHVDAVKLEADIASGSGLQEMQLSDGKLLIADLNADNPYITVTLNAQTTARDAVRLLSLPRINHADKLGLNAETASGSAKAHASLGFHFFAPKDAPGRPQEADVVYDIAAELKNVTQPGFMGKFDIQNANGMLTVKNEGLEYKGAGGVNGAQASDADIKYLFAPDKGFDTFIEVDAVAPVELLPRFGYPAFPFLKGTLGVKASVKQGDKAEMSQASFDLAHTDIAWKNFSLYKPAGVAASFELSAEKKDGLVRLTSLHLKGRDMEVKGSAELTKDMSDFQSVTLTEARYGQVDLDHVLYEPVEGGSHIEASGRSADLSGWMGTDDKAKGESSFSFAHFPVLKLKAQLGRVIVGKGRELEKLLANIDCNAVLCAGANVTGTTIDQKPFAFRILRNPKGQRQLSLHAQSAGAFLKAINVFDGMAGGDLTITGNYDDSGATSVLTGHADINEHTISHAPILARIVSLASLTGIFDTMQGNGIRFERLYAPFTLTNDVITLKDAKTHGPAIGLTANGTITFPKQKLDIEGTVVPSYTLNHVLGNVPLVGHLLTGGEGQGVFAARYSVKGSVSNPSVSVNPLAILTPGFLRGVFDIFDVPKKNTEE